MGLDGTVSYRPNPALPPDLIEKLTAQGGPIGDAPAQPAQPAQRVQPAQTVQTAQPAQRVQPTQSTQMASMSPMRTQYTQSQSTNVNTGVAKVMTVNSQQKTPNTGQQTVVRKAGETQSYTPGKMASPCPDPSKHQETQVTRTQAQTQPQETPVTRTQTQAQETSVTRTQAQAQPQTLSTNQTAKTYNVGVGKTFSLSGGKVQNYMSATTTTSTTQGVTSLSSNPQGQVTRTYQSTNAEKRYL